MHEDDNYKEIHVNSTKTDANVIFLENETCRTFCSQCSQLAVYEKDYSSIYIFHIKYLHKMTICYFKTNCLYLGNNYDN